MLPSTALISNNLQQIMNSRWRAAARSKSVLSFYTKIKKQILFSDMLFSTLRSPLFLWRSFLRKNHKLGISYKELNRHKSEKSRQKGPESDRRIGAKSCFLIASVPRARVTITQSKSCLCYARTHLDRVLFWTWKHLYEEDGDKIRTLF